MKKLIGALLGLALLVGAAPLASAQADLYEFGSFSGAAGLIPGSGTNSGILTINATLVLRKASLGTVAVYPQLTGLVSGTGNVTFHWQLSADGTNWTTTTPLTTVVARTGTTAVVARAELATGNARYLKLTKAVNADTEGATLTRVQWGRFK